MAGATQERISALLKRAFQWIKKPWEFTGPVSTPEFRDSVPDALQYRAFSPATPSKLASTPQSETAHIFDIKYFTRDRKRAPYEYSKKALDPNKISENPLPSPSVYTMIAKRIPFDYSSGDGYQK